jgi:hypothetical protein
LNAVQNGCTHKLLGQKRKNASSELYPSLFSEFFFH